MERKTIGEFIAVLRKANGLTQRQLAEKLNVSEKSISRWERNETSPDLALIPVIAELFSVTSDELLRGERIDPAAIAAPAPKQEKRIAYMLKQALTRHQIHSITSIGIALCGSVPTLLTCHFRTPFWAVITAIITLLVSAVFQITATIRTLSAIDSEEPVPQPLYQTRSTIIDRTFAVICAYISWGDIIFFTIYLGEGPLGFIAILVTLSLGLVFYLLLKASMQQSGFLAPPKED